MSPAQFPKKEWWPQNVRLGTLDALGPIPEHLIGAYDIVHVGLFVMMIRNENPVPFLENVKLLLSKPAHFLATFQHVIVPLRYISPYNMMRLTQLVEPGGYLQWDEVDVDSLRATPANPSIPRSNWDKWHAKSTALFAKRGITYK